MNAETAKAVEPSSSMGAILATHQFREMDATICSAMGLSKEQLGMEGASTTATEKVQLATEFEKSLQHVADQFSINMNKLVKEGYREAYRQTIVALYALLVREILITRYHYTHKGRRPKRGNPWRAGTRPGPKGIKTTRELRRAVVWLDKVKKKLAAPPSPATPAV